MISNTIVKGSALLGVILLLTGSVSAAEINAQVIAFACQTCHSIDKQKLKSGMVELKSRSADELITKLLDFKYNRQSSSIMGRISRGYTDAELQALAHYFSALK